jgi:hypothetical protein
MDLDGSHELRDLARQWLIKASDVARAAAATFEARQHVREVLEFSRPHDLRRMYELLGDVEVGGPQISQSYRKSLELLRGAGATPDDELRVIAKILSVETRSQGSVGARPSLQELNQLRDDGRRLAETAKDPLAKARFLIAEAFFPFWARVGGVPLEDADLARAEESANAGLEMAKAVHDETFRAQRSTRWDRRGVVARARARSASSGARLGSCGVARCRTRTRRGRGQAGGGPF